ncbi:MAG TPA: hypothetical protein VG603_12680, partial [Chitinophagales bacterium]|nr:hypothetical protein [Chitinophagales bacterium]
EKEKVVTALQAAGLASIFYKQKNYAKALEWINIYYGLEDAKVMPPLMLCIKLLEVLSLYGLGQLDLADTKATNLYKVYFRNKLNDEFYKLLGTVLRKLNHWHKNNKTDAIEISRLKTLFAKLKDNPNYVMYAQFVEPEEILDLVK